MLIGGLWDFHRLVLNTLISSRVFNTNMAEKFKVFWDSFLIMILNGMVFYKKPILDLAIIIFMAWGGAVMTASDGMTVEKWNNEDAFAHKRYYIGIAMVVVSAIKAFFSTAIVESKRKQEESDTGFIKKP